MLNFLKPFKKIIPVVMASLLCWSCAQTPTLDYNPWKLITIDTDSTFADLAFTDNPDHGWLVGNQATLFETNDGGDSWEEKIIDLGEEKEAFTGIDFNGEEGWITGKPSILLHTTDAGAHWSRIKLSSKLPGSPYSILALGKDSAEMVTDLGAIYKTTDGGKNWKALVEGAVGVARNISRAEDGRYVAVSSNGNFYSTWTPGDREWRPHNRNSSRRVQNMGFSKNGGIWLLARGGQIQFSEESDLEDWTESLSPEETTVGWGFLDAEYRTDGEIWLAGGSGSLFQSLDGGKTWKQDGEVENVPSNFYTIKFITPDKGFILGERGNLLKYDPSVVKAAEAESVG